MAQFSDIALQKKTPIAFTQVNKSEIKDMLAGRDMPFALQDAPSFYVTNQGGGDGDSRIAVRGFDQKNVVILLNGVPVNDLENAWLYWSDLDTVADVTSLIQLQRGISAITIPSQSIGGTMNIITDPASTKMGGLAQVEVGSDGYLKQSYVLNSGLLNNKFALSVAFSQKEGSGFANGTWTRATGYYMGASYQVNEKNRLEFYFIAAPQRHGQMTYEQNIATLNAGLAAKLGYTSAQLAAYPQQSMAYNQQYGPVSPNYAGLQSYWGEKHPRQWANSINQSENYYNYPVANLNWFANLTKDLKFDMVAYYIPGYGGGSGTLYTTLPSSTKVQGILPNAIAPYNWDAVIAMNQSVANTDSSGLHKATATLRNAVNKQKQYGSIAKLTYDWNNWKFTGGIDWRWAKIDHYQEVRDLLGGDYYIPSGSQYIYTYNQATGSSTYMTSLPHLQLGDKVGYWETNTIASLGDFIQGQYQKGDFSGFLVGSTSMANYKQVNQFVYNPDGTLRTLYTPKFHGFQYKGGILYAINKNFSAYLNAGDVSKIPLVSAAITSVGPCGLAPNVKNETYATEETGLRFATTDNKLTADFGFYHTVWNNHTTTNVVETTNPPTVTYNSGIDAVYNGVELEASYRPIRYVKFDATASSGNWYYTNDGNIMKYNQNTGALITGPTPLTITGLKVGNTPQTQMSLRATVYPVDGLSVNLSGFWANRYWSNFDPGARTGDYSQVWQVPNFNKYDLHVNYTLPKFSKYVDAKIFFHVLNMFNQVYIQDAQDNYFFTSSFPAGSVPASHSAQLAEVFLGTPRTYSAGVTITF